MKPRDHNIFLLLDKISPHAIKAWIKRYDSVSDYNAEHFAYFSHQRSKRIDELKQSLLANTVSFEFKGWKRVVSQQFSNSPLSTIGSVKSYPGGRFNIGNIDTERFPQFPALYLAEDLSTAYLEMMGIMRDMNYDGLTGVELAVAGNFSNFVINGKLTSVLDLTDTKSLQQFYNHLSEIKLPSYYRTKAAKLKIPPMLPIKNLNQLYETLFAEDWRLMPMQFDSPANSQVLGQIAYSAGIEGILYPSTKTNKKTLAIYPENFINSDGYIEIIGNVAATVINTRIDKDTYKNYLP